MRKDVTIRIKRIYDAPAGDDGSRVLIDRLWPRGVSKEEAQLDLWLKEVAPSTELREWFGHKPERFDEFSKRYNVELEQNPVVPQLEDLAAHDNTITLLYGAKDVEHNHAIVLQKFLERRL